ncbi:hypothetical protein pipiens_000318, partial [Culex pipiens pipiens]
MQVIYSETSPNCVNVNDILPFSNSPTTE